MNVFNLPGPEFLGFYFVLFVACTVIALFLRHRLRQPSGEPDYSLLDPYEIAFLKGGARSVVVAALAALTKVGTVATQRRANEVQVLPGQVGQSGGNRVEKWLYQEVNRSEGLSVEDLVGRFRALEDEFRDSLTSRGLLLTREVANKAYVLPLVVASVPLAVGAIKVAVGVSRDRPVAFLVITLVISLIIVGLCLLRTPVRTLKADSTLSALEAIHTKELQPTTPPDNVALLVGLYGSTILLNSPLEDLGRQLHPRVDNSTDSGISGCGGGGGGDGGGGGGGGCGGCSSH